MGWTFIRNDRPFRREPIDILKAEIEGENESGSWKWLDHAQRGNAWYVLVEMKGATTPIRSHVQDADGTFRYIVVILTSNKNNEFGTKVMDETVMPYYFDCPRRLIKKASPLQPQSEYAIRWRENCLKKKESKAKPQVGQMFKTHKPVTFSNGVSVSTFKTIKIRRGRQMRTFYTNLEGTSVYKFDPNSYGYDIIEESAAA